MKKYYLGEYEEIVLLTIGILNKEAYGVSIKNEIETRLERDVSMGAMHSSLIRLEDKGYIKSSHGEVTEERSDLADILRSLLLVKKRSLTLKVLAMNFGMQFQK